MPRSHTGALLGASPSFVRRLAAGVVASVALMAAAPPVGDPGDVDPPNAVTGARLYVSPATHAARQAVDWRRSRPRDAALMERIARQPMATWIGGWNRDVRGAVDGIVSAAALDRSVPVLVAYNIPQRDCGNHSSGGAGSPDGYRRWIRQFAAGIRGRPAVVILEPDATMVVDCLSGQRREQRFALLRDAVNVLKQAGATVYIDGGSPTFGRPQEMAARLRSSGIDRADGFALNVSNFVGNGRTIAAGEALSRLLNGKHFVIDTSRNGSNTATGAEWCNATGQALGTPPTTRTGHRLVDAYLWVKAPGESDGRCNGGPDAGSWWPDYALGLARRAR